MGTCAGTAPVWWSGTEPIKSWLKRQREYRLDDLVDHGTVCALGLYFRDVPARMGRWQWGRDGGESPSASYKWCSRLTRVFVQG